MSFAIVPGSISYMAAQGNKSIAETFLNAKFVILCDVSYSMEAHDAPGGRSRFDTMLIELAKLQKDHPGEVAVIEFSNFANFVPGGQPKFQMGGTELTKALEFAKMADVSGISFAVISDGEPNEPDSAIRMAQTFKAKINTIFVGPETDAYGGRAFLARLAAATGGITATADRVKELAATVERLLLTAG
jgi:hypothetical protein